MIINRSRRVVFFKTTKTASSSTEKLLTAAFSEDDILVTGKSTRISRLLGLWSHIPPSEARFKYFQSGFKGYKLIANFRNPWDRMVSEYFWESSRRGLDVGASESNPDLADHFNRYVKNRIRVQPVNKECSRLALNGRLQPIFFENFADSLGQILKDIGIDYPFHDDLPKINAGTRPAMTANYKKLYNEASIEKVGQLYSDWIKLGKYEY